MKDIEKLSEGDTVESIYTGKKYVVVSENGNTLQIKATDGHSQFSVATSDFKKVV